MNRRRLLKSAGAYGFLAQLQLPALSSGSIPNLNTLKEIGQRTHRRIGVFTVASDLRYRPQAAALIEKEFSMIGEMNDLKFADRLRPTPDSFDFSAGDYAVNWARLRAIPVRGHNLVWWNALPKWFHSFVSTSNAEEVMTNHISTVVKHYAGKLYSWDVVNEPIHHDQRTDGLRVHPWVELIGPQYLDLAFHTAAAADPKARLLLNECYIEHATPNEVERRAALLALLTRLRKSGVPITGLGIQGHLRGNTPIDKAGILTFLQKVKDLGLDVLITEMDVDDVDVPSSRIDDVVSTKYREFIELVGPYASSISFEWLNDDATQLRADGHLHRPNLYDSHYERKPVYEVVAAALSLLPRHFVDKAPLWRETSGTKS